MCSENKNSHWLLKMIQDAKAREQGEGENQGGLQLSPLKEHDLPVTC